MRNAIGKLAGLCVLGASGASALAAYDMFGVSYAGEYYRYDSANHTSQAIGSTGVFSMNAMAISPAGALYGSTFSSPDFVRIDLGTGAAAVIDSTFVDIRDMAFVGNTLYGLQETAGNDDLVTINTTTGVTAAVGTTGDDNIQAMASLPDGSLYAYSTIRGLMQINTATGLATDVNAGVGAASSIQGMAFDRDGVLYGMDTFGTFFRIDRQTGVTTAIGASPSDTRALVQAPRGYWMLMSRNAGSPERFFVNTGTMEVVKATGSSGLSDAGAGSGVAGAFMSSGITLMSNDAGNGANTSVGVMGSFMEGLAGMNGILYGVRDTAATTSLYQINTTTGAATFIGNNGLTEIAGLAAVNGVLYGWDEIVGLVTINPATGAAADVNAAIPGSPLIQSLEFTPDGALYGVGDKIYLINPATGEAVARGSAWTGTVASAVYHGDVGRLVGTTNTGTGFEFTDRIGTTVPLGWVSPNILSGMTFGDDGYVYAISRPGANSQLMRLDVATGAQVAIAAPVATDLRDLAWLNGTLYCRTAGGVSEYQYSSGTFNPVVADGANKSGLASSPIGRLFTNETGGAPGLVRYEVPAFSSVKLPNIGPAIFGMDTLPDDLTVGGGNFFMYFMERQTGQLSVVATPIQAYTLAYTGIQMTGTVTLKNFDFGSPAKEFVDIEIRHRGSTIPVEKRRVKLGAGGSITLGSYLSGSYDIAVKGRHWLRKVFNTGAVGAGKTFAVSLENGDVDGDNVVSVFDYIKLSDAFDATPSSANWNPNADLDGDDVVSVFDYIILSDNFDMVGDD